MCGIKALFGMTVPTFFRHTRSLVNFPNNRILNDLNLCRMSLKPIHVVLRLRQTINKEWS